MAYASRVLAPNPGPFTLEGTNTWVVGGEPSLVIDPGPDDPGHLAEVVGTAGTIGAILLTHRHPDHASGAASLSRLSGAPVLAFRPETGERELPDAGTVQGAGIRLRALHAPGHTEDHLVFHDEAFGSMFTGDVVLGRGTSIVDPPEGDMATYVATLERLNALAPRVLYPGHGPVVWEAREKLDEYLEHRLLRERQVLEALRSGPGTPEELVPSIYAGYPAELYPAAARSVLAHLVKLEREGRVRRDPAGGTRFAAAQARTRSRTRPRTPARAHRSEPPSSAEGAGTT